MGNDGRLGKINPADQRGLHILITGKPRTGKTTLIKRVVRACGPLCGGFYTEEMTRGGERIGFLIRTTDGEEAVLAEMGLPSRFRLGRYGINCENLENIGVAAVENAIAGKAIVIIDEIGKMELVSQRFKDMVIRALDSGKKVVGVLHCSDLPFLEGIRRREDLILLEATGTNSEEIYRRIASLLGICR